VGVGVGGDGGEIASAIIGQRQRHCTRVGSDRVGAGVACIGNTLYKANELYIREPYAHIHCSLIR
jgi:hypothetical protein